MSQSTASCLPRAGTERIVRRETHKRMAFLMHGASCLHILSLTNGPEDITYNLSKHRAHTFRYPYSYNLSRIHPERWSPPGGGSTVDDEEDSRAFDQPVAVGVLEQRAAVLRKPPFDTPATFEALTSSGAVRN